MVRAARRSRRLPRANRIEPRDNRIEQGVTLKPFQLGDLSELSDSRLERRAELLLAPPVIPYATSLIMFCGALLYLFGDEQGQFFLYGGIIFFAMGRLIDVAREFIRRHCKELPARVSARLAPSPRLNAVRSYNFWVIFILVAGLVGKLVLGASS